MADKLDDFKWWEPKPRKYINFASRYDRYDGSSIFAGGFVSASGAFNPAYLATGPLGDPAQDYISVLEKWEDYFKEHPLEPQKR